MNDTTIKSDWRFGLGRVRLQGLACALALVLVLIGSAGFKNLARLTLQASPAWLLAALAVYAGGWVCRTCRLRALGAGTGFRLGVATAFGRQVIGYALNSLLPARVGDVAIVVGLTRAGVPVGAALALLVQSRMLDALTLVAAACPLALLVTDARRASWVWLTLLGWALATATVVGLARVRGTRQLALWLADAAGRRFGRRLASAAHSSCEAYDTYARLVADGHLWLRTGALSLAMMGCEGLTCYCVAQAVGASLPVALALSSVALASLGKVIGLTPGGIGIYEGIMAAVLVWGGIAYDTAVTIAVLDHGLRKACNVAGALLVGVTGQARASTATAGLEPLPPSPEPEREPANSQRR